MGESWRFRYIAELAFFLSLAAAEDIWGISIGVGEMRIFGAADVLALAAAVDRHHHRVAIAVKAFHMPKRAFDQIETIAVGRVTVIVTHHRDKRLGDAKA